MNVIIRKATIDDKEEIFKLVKVFAVSFKTEYVSFNESIENIIDSKSSLLLVAEIDKKIIGYCLGFMHYTFYANGQVSWLEEIMIDEFFRRKSVGKMLVEEFEKWSKASGSKLVALATRRASNFYYTIGFEKSAEYFRKLL